MMSLPSLKSNAVIASAAWQSSSLKTQSNSGLLRRFAPRNDGQLSLRATQSRGNPFLNFIIILFLSTAPCQAAVKLDGVNDYIDIKTLPLTNTSNFTISTWVNLSSTPTVAGTIISLEESMGYLRIDINSSRQAQGYIFTGVQNYIGLTTLNLNQWYNLTYTRNGTDYRFFVNGLLQESRNLGNPVAGAGIEALGARNTTGSNYNINGTIDDTKIYNRPLSNGEILALYNSRSKRPSGSLANGLIAHYEMDDDAIGEVTAQAKDSSGNLNHGQFTGFNNLTTALSNDVPPEISNGLSLKFDGINDYSVSNINLSNTDKLTILFWYKTSSFTSGPILELTNNYNLSSNGFLINPNDVGGKFTFGIKGNIGYSTGEFNAPSTNNWHHYSALLDKSVINNEVSSIYVDGNLQVLTRTNNSNNTNNFGNSNLYFMSRAGTSFFQNGTLDDIRIYNRLLTASEISFLYNGSGLDPGTSNLQALWTFDHDSALKDSSGNNNHGVGVGGDSLKYTEGILRR